MAWQAAFSVDTKADGYLKIPFTIEELHAYIDKGMKIRDAYKELYQIVPDKKKFLELIQGKRQFRFIKDEAGRLKAQEIMESLNAAG